jgi:hypothetical protein
MYKITMAIEPAEIEQVIRQLNSKDRRQLLQKLVDEEFDTVVKKLGRNVKGQHLSAGRINQIVNQARREYYAKSRY